MASGYSRMAIRAAGMATRMGAAVRYQLVAPADDRPWSRRTTRPPTAAAQAVRPAMRRRWAAAEARGVLVSGVRISAGLVAGEGLRCSQTAMSDGPASATTTTAAARFQSALMLVPGMIARTRAAPATAAEMTVGATPTRISIATWRLEAPRWRSMTSSSSRRATTILAASMMTTTTITARLANSKSNTARTAVWAVMKAVSVSVMESLTDSSEATEANSDE